LNTNKLDEVRNKYQTENTIYEKSMAANGRNHGVTMLGGVHLHNKTQCSIKNFLERSISECSSMTEIGKEKPIIFTTM
jgi:hypothetical protein